MLLLCFQLWWILHQPVPILHQNLALKHICHWCFFWTAVCLHLKCIMGWYHTERSVVKSCDLHLPAAVSWQGCRARRSSSCWGIWLQWAWTSPVWQRCSSGSSSCIYPNPASNLDGRWAETQVPKNTIYPQITWRSLYSVGGKRFLDTFKYLLNPNYCL